MRGFALGGRDIWGTGLLGDPRSLCVVKNKSSPHSHRELVSFQEVWSCPKKSAKEATGTQDGRTQSPGSGVKHSGFKSPWTTLWLRDL